MLKRESQKNISVDKLTFEFGFEMKKIPAFSS